MYNWEDYQEIGELKFVNEEIIKYLNQRIASGQPTRVCLKNTSILDSSFFDKLTNSDLLQFRVVGGLDKPKYDSDYYKKRTTYSMSELRGIVSVLEDIESAVNPSWSETTRAEYLYSCVANNLTIDKMAKYRSSEEVCSLRTLISGKGACAAFALIYKELMDRQGISCDYVRGLTTGKAAWNVITTDGKTRVVDVARESKYIHNHPNNDVNHQYFGYPHDFVASHRPDGDERITDYRPYSNVRSIHLESNEYLSMEYARDDGTKFVIADITSDKDATIREYMQCEINVDGTLGKTNILMSESNIFDMTGETLHAAINSLLDKSRIERYTSNGANGYVGFLGTDNNKIYNEDLRNHPNPSKNYTRHDGTNLTLTKTSNQPFADKGVYSYRCCEFVLDEEGVVRAKVDGIYSEVDIDKFYGDTHDFVFASSSLERSRIDSKVRNSAGYVGSVIRYDNKLTKAASPMTEQMLGQARIKPVQSFSRYELGYSNIISTNVNGRDYRLVMDALSGGPAEQSNHYSKGFINYKTLVCLTLIFTIVLLTYSFITLYI